MLFRETLIDPLLSRYSVIMVSNQRNNWIRRNLNICQGRWSAWKKRLYRFTLGCSAEVCFMFCLPTLSSNSSRIRRKRPALRIIVSSATLDATKFLDYFSQGASEEEECTIVSLEGRVYPVEVAYLQDSTSDYVSKAAETTWNINLQVSLRFLRRYWPFHRAFQKQGSGDILIFLTGREDIERCAQELSDMTQTCVVTVFGIKLLIHPRSQFASSSNSPSDPAITRGLDNRGTIGNIQTSWIWPSESHSVNKYSRGMTTLIYVALNFARWAQASVTIDGIKFVVDSGFVKVFPWCSSSLSNSNDAASCRFVFTIQPPR